jgi:hypothetical protein
VNDPEIHFSYAHEHDQEGIKDPEIGTELPNLHEYDIFHDPDQDGYEKEDYEEFPVLFEKAPIPELESQE